MTQVAGDDVCRVSAAAGAGEVDQPTATCALRISDNALSVLRTRYLIKDENGKPLEAPADLYRRVARTIADVELIYDKSQANRSAWEERFYNLMADSRFMPNSPTLMNAGREMGMLSACFVLPVRDSINEIFDAIKHTALIQKAGGGTGFAFDELRPTGDYIKSSGGTTSGPISFWRAFSEATNAIQQGAFRRGANMGMMSIDHPDILKFLHAKQDLNQFTNYNISVKVTDAWMEAFRGDGDSPHVVRNPRTGLAYFLPRSLDIWKYTIRSLIPADEQPAPGSVYTRRDIWRIIVQNAWRTGEPGVVFIDRINENNPTPHIGRMEATNPCGEQPLLAYEACNLGSINLSQFIRSACTPRAEVDWDALRTTIHQATRFLDNVIDANKYPLPEIDAICKGNRKIGVGVMGFADALFKLNVGYNTEQGIAWGERFMQFVNDEAHACSEQLARSRGSFPNWKGSTWDTRFNRPMRNACTTTVAPTGTISIIADCSCGIEPLFSLVFYRNVMKGQRHADQPMIEVNSVFRRVASERGFSEAELFDRIATDGTLAHIDDLPAEVRRTFVCAHDISPEWHVKMQAAFQKHCDASISKTINFPNSATTDDVETIFRMSYDLKCKGVTVYRDGCRVSQPMALKKDDPPGEPVGANGPPAAASSVAADPVGTQPATRPADGPVTATTADIVADRKPERAPLPADLPELLSSVRVKQMTPFGNMHVQITVDPKRQRELEVFAQLGKGGDLANSDLEAICRLTSLWLRAGGGIKHVIRQLKGIGSSLQVSTRNGKIMSLGDGLAQAMTKYVRARTHFGLRSLLLGDFDPEEMGCILAGRQVTARAGGTNGKTSSRSNGSNGRNQGPPPTAPSSPRTGDPGARIAQTQQEAFKVICPECHSALRYGEGCVMCPSCGYSHC